MSQDGTNTLRGYVEPECHETSKSVKYGRCLRRRKRGKARKRKKYSNYRSHTLVQKTYTASHFKNEQEEHGFYFQHSRDTHCAGISLPPLMVLFLREGGIEGGDMGHF